MEKKLSVSSRLVKQTRVSAESILIKPLTKRQKAVLESAAERQERGDTLQIDFSDIPTLTEKQLAQFQRPRKRLVAGAVGCVRVAPGIWRGVFHADQ